MKLWTVSIRQIGVALAESEADALSLVRQISTWETPELIATQIGNGDVPAGWGSKTLVYNSLGQDITLRQAKQMVSK